MDFLKKLYDKILESCDSKYAVPILAFLSFTESCIFFIPPELTLLPMSFANRKKAMYYALVASIAAVLGAMFGYLIGDLLWDSLKEPIFNYLPGFKEHFEQAGAHIKENAFLGIFLGAFTPIPFKVFTVGAGVYSDQVSLMTLIFASAIGRGARYFLLAGMLVIFGQKVQELIAKHFALMTSVIGLAVVILIYFLKFA